MAEPLKNMINKQVIENMAKHFKRHWSGFNEKGFLSDALNGLDVLELKERTTRITHIMHHYFPKGFVQAGKIMKASLGAPLENEKDMINNKSDGVTGWSIISLVEFVGLYGQDHFDFSMDLLKEMTKRLSSEYGIRFFLLKSPKKTLAVMKAWAQDNNMHVRRLASEGCRPRLPWAMTLPRFIDDPKPLLSILEKLKDDPEEYVRRSVANNLNDIAKDHPEIVSTIAARWMINASENRKKLIRHACRTLIKTGHKQTLKILGFESPKIKNVQLALLTPKVTFGHELKFSLSISSNALSNQPLIIDYIIHHQKANGKTTPKVFKWRAITLPAKKKLEIEKKHRIKKITTREYYPGLHKLEIMVNGVSIGMKKFQLLID